MMVRLTMSDLLSRRALLALATVTSGLMTVHCSSSRETFEPPPKEEPTPTGPFVDASTPADAEEPLPDCSEENKLIYVVTQRDKGLYRFDPQALTFTLIGLLKCPTSVETFSMAVDRRGTAWVAYEGGRLFKVSTKDASCEPTSYRPGGPNLVQFGMGFAKDDTEAGAPESETLYLAGEFLARLDLGTMESVPIGTATTGLAELTGTGAGTLYAFPRTTDQILRLDKTTGAILEVHRPDVNIGFGAWAFAQWGGSFWLFTSELGRSMVTQYTPSTNTTKTVLRDLGLLIVGAGSSTCAPSEPPR